MISTTNFIDIDVKKYPRPINIDTLYVDGVKSDLSPRKYVYNFTGCKKNIHKCIDKSDTIHSRTHNLVVWLIAPIGRGSLVLPHCYVMDDPENYDELHMIVIDSVIEQNALNIAVLVVQSIDNMLLGRCYIFSTLPVKRTSLENKIEKFISLNQTLPYFPHIIAFPHRLPIIVKKTSEDNCVICLTNERTHAFIPCGHLCVCDECEPADNRCPLCRSKSSGAYKIWK